LTIFDKPTDYAHCGGEKINDGKERNEYYYKAMKAAKAVFPLLHFYCCFHCTPLNLFSFLLLRRLRNKMQQLHLNECVWF